MVIEGLAVELEVTNNLPTEYHKDICCLTGHQRCPVRLLGRLEDSSHKPELRNNPSRTRNWLKVIIFILYEYIASAGSYES